MKKVVTVVAVIFGLIFVAYPAEQPRKMEVSKKTLKARLSPVAAGSFHTCAVTPAGGVKCWGINDYGQLGNGATENHFSPVDVSGLDSGVISLAAGGFHTCALTSAGAVKCWGDNKLGQLGDGTKVNRPAPVDVVSLSGGVVAIVAGGYHTCALDSEGRVKCWGYNEFGKLLGGDELVRTQPTDIPDFSGKAIAIAAGGFRHTCALTSEAGVKCWGANTFGQLGDGTNVNTNTPVEVKVLGSETAAIDGGNGHVCALTHKGKVVCWGWNHYGQLGDGSTENRNTPVEVAELKGRAGAISAGGHHTCLITKKGGVKCWGDNGAGQLGDGATENRLTPVDVAGLNKGVAAISAGEYHTCAIMSKGNVKCWGSNNAGQIGDGKACGKACSTPVDVSW